MTDFESRSDTFQDRQAVRLLLIEDHALIRQSLIELLHRHTPHQVVGDTSSGREAISLAVALQPDLIVMDFHLGDGVEGLDLIKALRAACPQGSILVLSADASGQRIEDIIRCGAQGFVSKSGPPEELFSAINQVLEGRSATLDPAPAITVDALSVLTDRERNILRLVASGYAIREIAVRLKISRKTVEGPPQQYPQQAQGRKQRRSAPLCPGLFRRPVHHRQRLGSEHLEADFPGISKLKSCFFIQRIQIPVSQ